MTLPELPYDFYGSVIHQAIIGPRREITLVAELWPTQNDQRIPKWEPGDGQHISIRFGGIRNYEEVTEFFGSWDDNPSRHNGLHYLTYAPEKKSKLGDLHLLMEFDATEAKLEISCSSLTFGEA